MVMALKQFFQAVTPPFIQTQMKNIFLKKKGYFSGPYSSWAQAQLFASGYDDKMVLETVKQSTMQAKNNRGLFVRDGVVFAQPQYSYPLLAGMLKVAIEKESKFSILDFGGGLGTSYYAFRNFCPPNIAIDWYIVEQRGFVECGNALFKDNELSFYTHVKDIPIQPDIVLVSGALQYVEQPYQLLECLFSVGADYFILDRTWVSYLEVDDRILVEHVPQHIYKSSYPSWLFNHTKLLNTLSKNYESIFEFEAIEGKFLSNGFEIASKGAFMKRRSL